VVGGFSRRASGNILPYTFVTLDTTTAPLGQVAQCTSASVKIFGISGADVRFAPLAGLDDGFHAVAGMDCLVYAAPTDRPMLRIGGTVTVGDTLGCEGASTGRGITITQGGTAYYGAIALDSGVVDDLIPVEPIPNSDVF
jgi:hypothetical protein